MSHQEPSVSAEPRRILPGALAEQVPRLAARPGHNLAGRPVATRVPVVDGRAPNLQAKAPALRPCCFVPPSC